MLNPGAAEVHAFQSRSEELYRSYVFPQLSPHRHNYKLDNLRSHRRICHELDHIRTCTFGPGVSKY